VGRNQLRVRRQRKDHADSPSIGSSRRQYRSAMSSGSFAYWVVRQPVVRRPSSGQSGADSQRALAGPFLRPTSWNKQACLMLLYGNGEMPEVREAGTDPLYEDLGGPEQSATVSFGPEQAYLSNPH
jgi:hypothetical protein